MNVLIIIACFLLVIWSFIGMVTFLNRTDRTWRSFNHRQVIACYIFSGPLVWIGGTFARILEVCFSAGDWVWRKLGEEPKRKPLTPEKKVVNSQP